MDFYNVKFIKSEIEKIRDETFIDWPVVYFIHNENIAYIGETTNIYNRLLQHLKISEREVLSDALVITDEMFNKSAILDFESTLIKLVDADKKYELQNLNTGLQNHNYYQKKIYERKFDLIWKYLISKELATSEIYELENSVLFKYSPFKTLTPEQYVTVDNILDILAKDINGSSLSFICGGAGTGKTILAIYMMKLLRTNPKSILASDEEMDVSYGHNLIKILEGNTNLVIGLVIPMQSLRATLKKVFKGIKGLSPDMVISPEEVFEKRYDILIVDEAHRLKRRKNLGRQFGSFDRHNAELNLGNDGTQLDWILARSSHQILFYDEGQSIKPSDIRKERFEVLKDIPHCFQIDLKAQLRCLGGTEYVNYINDLFHCRNDLVKKEFDKFEFMLFDNIQSMYDRINDKERFGLSRMVAGYSWSWKTKGKSKNDIETNKLFDMEIQKVQFIWNINQVDWIDSRIFTNEVGCIHTTQGYDLNFVGVIIGSDIGYDTKNNKIKIYKDNYCDLGGTPSIQDITDLEDYITNIYITLCLRGIRGVYLYVVDLELKDFISRFVNRFIET